MKKIFTLIALLLMFQTAVQAEQRVFLGGFEVESRVLTQDEFGYKKVRESYVPVELKIYNRNPLPISLTAASYVEFVTEDGDVIKSETRRNFYKKVRRVDYFPPTFIIDIQPWAGPSNVRLARDFMITNPMPIRFESKEVYNVHVFIPKRIRATALNITNVTFDKKQMCDIHIPLNIVEEL